MNDSSKVCRIGYFWFFMVSVYVGLVIAATKDTQLLFKNTLSLPVLNFDVPVTTLYMILPILYILVHFYTLLQLSLLVPKLQDFEKICGNQQQEKLLLLPFVFNEAVLNRSHNKIILYLMRLQVWITLLVMPLVLTLMIQYRYLPMHDSVATFWHQVFIVIHVLIVGFFWGALFYNRSRDCFKHKFGRKLMLCRQNIRYWRSFLRSAANLFMLLLCMIVKERNAWLLMLVLFFSICVFRLLPTEQDHMNGWNNTLAKYVYNDYDYAVGQEEFQPSPLEKMLEKFEISLHRNLNIQQSNLTNVRDRSALAKLLNEYQFDFYGNKQLEYDQVTKKRNRNRFFGLNLKNRDLRYANFSESVLVNANIEGADLRGMTAERANFTYVYGDKYTKMDGANFADTVFNGSKLGSDDGGSGARAVSTDFSHTSFINANLLNVSFISANLFNVDFTNSKIDLSDIWLATLDNASFETINQFYKKTPLSYFNWLINNYDRNFFHEGLLKEKYSFLKRPKYTYDNKKFKSIIDKLSSHHDIVLILLRAACEVMDIDLAKWNKRHINTDLWIHHYIFTMGVTLRKELSAQDYTLVKDMIESTECKAVQRLPAWRKDILFTMFGTSPSKAY